MSPEPSQRQRSAHDHASRPSPERHEAVLRLQRTHGNQAVQRLLSGPETPVRIQRAPAPTTAPPATTPAAAPVAAAAETKTLTPLEQAQALVQESPANVKDRAAWILKAADQGFVTFNTNKAKANLENVRDEKKVENLDPKATGYDVPILEVEVGLAKDAAQRWIDAKGAGAKSSIQFGSMIRSGTTDPHARGKAIDINALDMTTSVDATVMILNDLDTSIHTSYGLGFPFQGDFFTRRIIWTRKNGKRRAARLPLRRRKRRRAARPRASLRQRPNRLRRKRRRQ